MFAAVLSLGVSCERESSRPASGEQIQFASPLKTRAYASPAPSTYIFQVRDWYNDNSFHIDNETIRYNTATLWRYGSGSEYTWDNGIHQFFGWLDTDGELTTTGFFGSQLTPSGTTLTLPAKEVNTSTTQYDFVYSDMVSRRTADNDYDPIPLTFKHLFAQVGISFRVSDVTDEVITLKRVYLRSNLYTGKQAVIDFSTAEPAVTYTGTSTGYLVTPQNLNIAGMDKDAVAVDVLAQVQNGARNFYYVWPMTEDELMDDVESDRPIVVEYTLTKNSKGENVSVDYVSAMNFPNGTKWEAGNKYQYVISYMGGICKVEETVLPWEYVESNGSDIPEPTVVTFRGWDDNTCTVSGVNVTFKDDGEGGLRKIHGVVTVGSPSNCTLHINLTNHVSGDDVAYAITDAHNNDVLANGITIGGPDGVIPGSSIDFYISAIEARRPAAGQAPLTSQMSFSLRASDRDVDLDSELQRDGPYVIIIPAKSE